MSNITVLAHSDAIEIDSDCLGSLYSEMGLSAADAMVCRALEEIANRLSRIERSYYKSDFNALAKSSKGLIGIADQVGLSELARVAKSVTALSKTADHPALASTIARLVRLGDRSLTAIWEVQDLNGSG